MFKGKMFCIWVDLLCLFAIYWVAKPNVAATKMIGYTHSAKLHSVSTPRSNRPSEMK
jgi:hypothetical protein